MSPGMIGSHSRTANEVTVRIEEGKRRVVVEKVE